MCKCKFLCTRQTSDLNEIEASRAHRRGSMAGNNIPRLSVAVVADAAAALAKETPPASPHSRADSGRVFSIHSQHTRDIEGASGVLEASRSRRWRQAVRHQKVLDKYACSIGGTSVTPSADDTGTSSRLWGFDVAAAIQRTHGVSIQHFKKRLDNPAGCLEVR